MQDKDGRFKLAHSDHTAYNSMFRLPGQVGLQFIVPGPPQISYGIIEGSLPKLSKSITKKIKSKYEEWSKGTSKFNITYNMPDFFPIINLAIFHKAKIFTFKKFEKLNVTDKIDVYKEFKVKVLIEILKDQNIKDNCRVSIQKLFDDL